MALKPGSADEIMVSLLFHGLRLVAKQYLLFVVSILLHELAHWLAAIATGMQVRKVSLGYEGIPGFRIGILFVSILPLPAYVEIADIQGSTSHKKLGLFYFAGPFMSLCLMLLFVFFHHLQGAFMNLLLLLASLLPYPKGKTDMGGFLSLFDKNGR